MNKIIRWPLIIILLIANFIMAIDTFLYLSMSPEISTKMIIIFFVFLVGLNLTIFKVKTNKKLFVSQWLLVFLYCVFILFLSRISSERGRALWAITNTQLDMIEERLQVYYENNNTCPPSLNDIASDFIKGEKASRDFFSNHDQFKYKVLDNNTCMVYSVGIDGMDGGGTVPLNKDAIGFSPNVSPWTMPFGKCILHISGFDGKIKGDIVRKIHQR